MSRIANKTALLIAALLIAALLVAPPASAAFGLNGFDVTFTEADGSPTTQAGSHPYAMTTRFRVNTAEVSGKLVTEEGVKDVLATQIPGFIGNQTAVPPCSTLDFLTLTDRNNDTAVAECADGSAVGSLLVFFGPDANEPNRETFAVSPIYLLDPAPGTVAKLGTWVKGVPVTIDVGVSELPPYNIVGVSRNISQLVEVFGVELTLWGDPASPLHDRERGLCHQDGPANENGQSCPAGIPEVPFLTVPRACQGPLSSSYEADSWLHPGTYLSDGRPNLSDPSWVTGSALSHDDNSPPNPLGLIGCGNLAFNPSITAQPTSRAAESPTGLDFSLDVNDEGVINPSGRAQSEIRKAVVTLPEGITANPSLAEGLGVCTEAQLKMMTAKTVSGEGCPEASKIGTVEIETPVLKGRLLKGSLFVAKPYENLADDSLIGLYLVIKDSSLGILIKQTLKVEPDPRTGQLVTVDEEIPQLPFSHFRLHFREGGRSPLISPPSCGEFRASAELTPWSGGAPITTTAPFTIVVGPNGGTCPVKGTLPFIPGFSAGTLNNNAGSYSPFLMRLTRRDGDQDLTRFDATLPRGLIAKLAGVSKCPDQAIAETKLKSGRAELANPSCPVNSKIGSVIAGAGVGSQLTYVPGSIYLAGPFGGAPLSVVGVVPAVAGPFDVGTVVTRQALNLDPVTAEVKVDGAHSDPIPHILAGIPLRVRDIRVSVDRPNFTLNPTSCAEMSIGAALWGGGSDPFTTADDSPVSLAQRFQAADCASLAFKPRLALRLKGGVKRGSHPALRATLTYPPGGGNANVGKAVVTLPHSAFLEQAHIRTICTRVQFAAKACPKGAIYGKARAFTPLLDEPLEGPVYLRSSNHKLPDLVAALHGIVDIDLVGRIDSVNASIRSSFENVPDAPVSKFVLEMQGGKKGLIVNSRNLCAHKSRAIADFTGQNGKTRKFRPVVKADCGKKAKKKRRR